MRLKTKFVTSKGGPAMPEMKKYYAQIQKELNRAQKNLEKDSIDISKKTVKYMADRVRAKTKRQGATGALAESIEESLVFGGFSLKTAGNRRFWAGIRKTTLEPYWAMINYGGYISSEYLYGTWTDSATGKSDYSKRGGVGKGQFIVGGKDATIMTPRKPIKGFNYIAYGNLMAARYAQKLNIFRKAR